MKISEHLSQIAIYLVCSVHQSFFMGLIISAWLLAASPLFAQQENPDPSTPLRENSLAEDDTIENEGNEAENSSEDRPKNTINPIESELEPLVKGKEGLNYYYKKLLRRGQDHYQMFQIQGQQVQIDKYPGNFPGKVATSPQLIPESSQKQSLLRDFQNYAANDFVELLFEMKEFPPYADTLYILNRLLQLKTMTGILYFSTRQQKMTKYIKSCYVVEGSKGPKRRKEIEPPQFEQLPTQPVRLVIRQDDNRFTPTWFDVTVRIGEDGAIRLTMENITPIYVQFIFYFKALDAHKVRHEIVILPGQSPNNADNLQNGRPIVYALSQIHNRRTKVMGIELDLGNSFNRRMSAIQGWISQRIYIQE